MALISATPATNAAPRGVAAFVEDRHLTRYSVALSDLNGDGRAEALVYAMAMATAGGGGQADLCGSGGCILYVLSLTPGGYRRVTGIPVARPPVRVLSTAAQGWRDIGVCVAGGGIASGYKARLRFDGYRYPSNPTVPPAIRLTKPMGRTVIGELPTLSRR